MSVAMPRSAAVSSARASITKTMRSDFGNGLLGLLAHAGGDAAGLGVLQPRRIGQDDVMLADADARFLAIAREPRHVVDKRQPLAREAVENAWTCRRWAGR